MEQKLLPSLVLGCIALKEKSFNLSLGAQGSLRCFILLLTCLDSGQNASSFKGIKGI